MLRFPPAQLDAPATVFPSLITSPSIVQHLSPGSDIIGYHYIFRWSSAGGEVIVNFFARFYR